MGTLNDLKVGHSGVIVSVGGSSPTVRRRLPARR